MRNRPSQIHLARDLSTGKLISADRAIRQPGRGRYLPSTITVSTDQTNQSVELMTIESIDRCIGMLPLFSECLGYQQRGQGNY